AQHVVAPAELLGSLHHRDVLGSLDHTHDVGVAAGIHADAALLPSGHVEAPPARAHLLAHLHDRLGQPPGVDLVDCQQVEGQALGGLAPYPRKPRQLVDDSLDGSLEHQPNRPPRSSPPVSPPSWSPAASAAVFIAWFTAATIRSWSISTSSGSTTDGSIVTSSSSCAPDTTAVTTPPPADPSNRRAASSSCAAASCSCIFWACFISWRMSGWRFMWTSRVERTLRAPRLVAAAGFPSP